MIYVILHWLIVFLPTRPLRGATLVAMIMSSRFAISTRARQKAPVRREKYKVNAALRARAHQSRRSARIRKANGSAPIDGGKSKSAGCPTAKDIPHRRPSGQPLARNACRQVLVDRHGIIVVAAGDRDLRLALYMHCVEQLVGRRIAEL